MSPSHDQPHRLAIKAQSINPGSPISIVANRLPSLSYRNYSGYGITDIDPLTGALWSQEKKSTPVPLVALDANGFIHYTPEANYYGAANDEFCFERRAA